MAPEQARGEATDPRSDLFSVGVVLHRMVTGRSPFERGNYLDTLNAVSTTEVLPPAGLPPEVGRFIARLMAKKPDDRPKDAAAALAELRSIRLQDGDKGASRPGGGCGGWRQPARRQRYSPAS